MLRDNKRKSSTQTKKIILVIFVALSVLIMVPNIPKSYAHAFVVGSNPSPSTSVSTPPSQVEVDFIDPIDIHYSTLKILDSNGKAVQNKDLHYVNNDHSKLAVGLPASTPNGIYTVYSKVLDTTDGHVTENAFVFAIGEPVPQQLSKPKESASFSDIVIIPDAIARIPALVGQVIVVGATFSSMWLWRPISRNSSFKNRLEPIRIKIEKSMTKFVLIGAIIVLGGDFAMIGAVAYTLNVGLLDAINTNFGQLWLIRLVFSLVLLGVSLFVYFKQKKTDAILHKGLTSTLFGIGIAVLATTTLISHGAATGHLIPFFLDFVHNVVASLWIGGVLYIDFVILSKLKKEGGTHLVTSTLSMIIPRFSALALAILGTVAITGPFLLYALENNLSIILFSIYGEILIVKLSLAAVMIVIGSYHQMAIHRQTVYAISTKNESIPEHLEHHKSILSKFGWSVKIEAMVGIALLVSIAFLVDSGLPETQYQNELAKEKLQIPQVYAITSHLSTTSQNQFTDTRFTDSGDRIVFIAKPFFAGSNNVTISFLDPNKKPININSTKITLTEVDKGIGPIEVDDAQQISPGVFSVNTDAFAIPGHWQAQVEGITNVAGALNVVTTFDDLYVKPSSSQLQANMQKFEMPDNKSLPLYPIYDSIRNVVWVGDTAINSGRMWEFDIDSKKFIEHKIEGVNIITAAALDAKDNIWYIDPITKILGYYMPDNKTNQEYSIPNKQIASGLALDGSGNVWLTMPSSGQILKFDVGTKTFHPINMSANSLPLGISVDQTTGQIWVAESGTGKIADIDPAQNYKITEYAPKNGTLSSPTAILPDPITGKIFVSEHDGKAVSALDPLLGTFQRYNLDPKGLPFGMSFDSNHDLWVAQHTLDKIAVVDPRTGQTNEFDIPTKGSFTQWVTTDSHGNIILAEQRGNALAILTTSVKPGFVQNNNQVTGPSIFPQLGFNYAEVAGPSIACALVAVAFFYSKSVIDLKSTLREIRKHYSSGQMHVVSYSKEPI